MNKPRGMLVPRTGVTRQTFGSLFFADNLAPTPTTFGQQKLISDAPNGWGVLGNLQWGDCMFAGMAHAVMYLNAQIGNTVAFTDAGVLADYGAVTGFTPSNPASDVGTDVDQGISYWTQTGMIDAAGNRHRISGSAALPVGDFPTLLRATFLLGVTGIGFALPDSAETQFDNAEPWDDIGSPPGDGHFVPGVALNSKGQILVVSWGRIQAVTPAFIKKYMIFGTAPLSLEWIKNNISPRGINEPALAAYVGSLA